eukprot:780606-Rhodomonas_salina.3
MSKTDVITTGFRIATRQENRILLLPPSLWLLSLSASSPPTRLLSLPLVLPAALFLSREGGRGCENEGRQYRYRHRGSGSATRWVSITSGSTIREVSTMQLLEISGSTIR